MSVEESSALLGTPPRTGKTVTFAEEPSVVMIGGDGDRNGSSPLPFFEPEPKDAEEAVKALQPDTTEKGMGFLGATMNMVKLMLGAGVLALPNAFSKAGIWPATALYPILGAIAWFTMMLLLDAKNEACVIIKKRRKQYKDFVEKMKSCETTTESDSRVMERDSVEPAGKDEDANPVGHCEVVIDNGSSSVGKNEVSRSPAINDSDKDVEEDEPPKMTDTLAAFAPSKTYGALDSASYKPPEGSLDLVKSYRGVGAFAFGAIGKWMVMLSVVLLQLCFCTGYVILSSNTFERYFPSIHRGIVVFAIVLPVFAMLAMIRWIKDLTIVSVFGTLTYIVGIMGVTFYLGIPVVFSPRAPDFTEPVVLSTLPLFVGSAMYSIEGINGVLPIESAMEHPKKAPSAMLVATMGYVGIVAVFSVVAYAAGFGRFDIVTHAFPTGTLRTIVEWALVVSLTLTYPLQLFPATETLEEQFQVTHGKAYKRFLLRISLVLTTVCTGYFMKDFSLFSGFVGSFFLSFAGFIIPAASYLKIVGFSHGIAKWISSVAILLGGVVLLVTGTYRSIVEIVNAL